MRNQASQVGCVFKAFLIQACLVSQPMDESDGTMSSNMVGKILLDQFRIDSFIAAGGMGTVFKVWDLQRNTWMAIKTLHSDLAEDPVIFKRFQREANALKRLAHPNIVPFYGLYHTEDISFLVERYIDGPSLKEIIHGLRGKPMPVQDALIYLRAVSSALGYAHNSGVVHCDVKPGNVIVDQGGQIFLTDFGIVRHADSTLTSMASMGTPAYMAPEQIRGEAVSPATDVYAFGILAYELFTGRRPFTGNEPIEGHAGERTTGEALRLAQVKLPPPDPRSINAALPPALTPVLLKALEKDPALRFTSVQAFWLNICQAVGGVQQNVPERANLPGMAPHVPVPNSPAVPAAAQADLAAFVKRDPKWIFIALAAVTVLVILVSRTATNRQPGAAPFASTQISAVQAANTDRLPAQQTPTTARPTNTPAPKAAGTSPGGKTLIPPPGVVTPTLTPVLPSQTATRAPANGNNPTGPQDQAPMVYIAEGKFWQGLNDDMIQKLLAQCSKCTLENFGDTRPLHQVFLSTYWIGKYEVTNQQYHTCVDAGACTPPSNAGSRTRTAYYSDSKYNNFPVVYVNWNQAQQYCAWAGGRLPTEAEWEKAARGVNDTRLFPWGDNDGGGRMGNNDALLPDLVEVGSYLKGASPYGVMDLAGNVYEWTGDWYGGDYYTQQEPKDPPGPSGGKERVIRGGSQDYRAAWGSVSFRDDSNPTETTDQVGFRCVIVVQN